MRLRRLQQPRQWLPSLRQPKHGPGTTIVAVIIMAITIAAITAVIITAAGTGIMVAGSRSALAPPLPLAQLPPPTITATGGMASAIAISACSESDAGRIAPVLERGRGFSYVKTERSMEGRAPDGAIAAAFSSAAFRALKSSLMSAFKASSGMSYVPQCLHSTIKPSKLPGVAFKASAPQIGQFISSPYEDLHLRYVAQSISAFNRRPS